jgi:hypothetical protein
MPGVERALHRLRPQCLAASPRRGRHGSNEGNSHLSCRLLPKNLHPQSSPLALRRLCKSRRTAPYCNPLYRGYFCQDPHLLYVPAFFLNGQPRLWVHIEGIPSKPKMRQGPSASCRTFADYATSLPAPSRPTSRGRNPTRRTKAERLSADSHAIFNVTCAGRANATRLDRP